MDFERALRLVRPLRSAPSWSPLSRIPFAARERVLVTYDWLPIAAPTPSGEDVPR